MRRLFGLLALTGCGNEYHFYDVGNDPFYRVGTYELPQTQSYRFDLDDDGYYDTCSTTSSYVHIFDFTGTTIHYAVVYSTNAYDVDPPSSWEPVDLWTLYVGPAGYWAVYPGDQYTSGQSEAVMWSSDPNDGWYAEFSAEDLEDFNFCYPNCSFYTFGTEIHDALTAQSDSCVFYDEANDSPAGKTSLDVYVYYNNETEEGDTPSKARCVPGSGTFQLVPYRFQDANGDGLVSTFFRAMQESGTRTRTGLSVLTGDATVTKVTPLNTNGTTLRVMHQDKSFSFDDDDHLVTTRGAYTSLREGRASRFTSGQLSGGVPFVSEDNVEGDEPIEVNMTWTCPLASTDGADDGFEQGYTFALKDIGCTFAPTQKITVRPVLDIPEPYVQVELYGMTTNNLKVPVTYNGGRWYFTSDLYGSEVVGSIAPTSDEEGLDVDFDTIRYWDADYCTTGEYVFAKEG